MTSMTNKNNRPEPRQLEREDAGSGCPIIAKADTLTGEEITEFKERDAMVRHCHRSIITSWYSPVRYLDFYVPSALEFSSISPIVDVNVSV